MKAGTDIVTLVSMSSTRYTDIHDSHSPTYGTQPDMLGIQISVLLGVYLKIHVYRILPTTAAIGLVVVTKPVACI